MKTYELFIGANNNTHEVEQKLAESILAKHADGFSIIPVTGYWLGNRENSIQVIISVEDVKTLIDELKTALHQDAIAYRVTTGLQFV